jgi:hypothetical protein
MIPERKRFDALLQSGLMDRLAQSSFGEKGNPALGAITDEIAAALAHNTDASDLALSVCSSCGYLLIDTEGGVCPNCEGTDIVAVQ